VLPSGHNEYGRRPDGVPAVILRCQIGQTLFLNRATHAPARPRASRVGGVVNAGLGALLGLIAGRHGLVGAVHRRSRPFQAVFAIVGSRRGGGRKGEHR
jgi:hypothetical protein